MSFICAVTRKPSAKGEKPTKLVVETRPKVYQHDNGTSFGNEIVKEINVSAEGLVQLARIRDLASNEERKCVQCGEVESEHNLSSSHFFQRN